MKKSPKNLTISYVESKNWWKRLSPVNSREWRSIRLKVLNRDDWKCNFCGIKLSKFMVVDHIDGSALNNSLNNLRTNCPSCDRIRHCGLATINNLIATYFSNLSQLQIVKRTHDFYFKNRRVPLPKEIDRECKAIGLTPIEVAEIRFKIPRSVASKSLVKAKAFFTELMDFRYLDFKEDDA